jgi:hypothetical protein
MPHSFTHEAETSTGSKEYGGSTTQPLTNVSAINLATDYSGAEDVEVID